MPYMMYLFLRPLTTNAANFYMEPTIKPIVLQQQNFVQKVVSKHPASKSFAQELQHRSLISNNHLGNSSKASVLPINQSPPTVGQAR